MSRRPATDAELIEFQMAFTHVEGGEGTAVLLTIAGLDKGQTGEADAAISLARSQSLFQTDEEEPCVVDVQEHSATEQESVYAVAGVVSCPAPLAALGADGELTISDFEFRGLTVWN